MMLALHNGAPMRPYTYENSDSIISLKALVPAKTGDKMLKRNVAIISVLRTPGAEEQAEFLLFAANNIDKAMKIVEFLWDMRDLLDDSGYGKNLGEPVAQSPELVEMIKEAERILYPEKGVGRYEPKDAPARVREVARPVVVPAPAPAPTTVHDTTPDTVDPEHPDLSTTPNKIRDWEKQ